MAAVQPVEVNAQGHSVYRWVEEWPECFWWKANAHMLILEDDELDYTIEYAPNCCNSYVHAYNPEGQKTSVPSSAAVATHPAQGEPADALRAARFHRQGRHRTPDVLRERAPQGGQNGPDAVPPGPPGQDAGVPAVRWLPLN